MATDVKFVRVYMKQSDKFLKAVMSYLHFEAKVQGVTVIKAISGYGKSGAMLSVDPEHEDDNNLPLVLEFFDEETKVMTAIDKLKTMLGSEHIVSWTAQLP